MRNYEIALLVIFYIILSFYFGARYIYFLNLNHIREYYPGTELYPEHNWFEIFTPINYVALIFAAVFWPIYFILEKILVLGLLMGEVFGKICDWMTKHN